MASRQAPQTDTVATDVNAGGPKASQIPTLIRVGSASEGGRITGERITVIEGDAIEIGRRADGGPGTQRLVLSHEKVSTHHAIIRRHVSSDPASRFVVHDLGSTNGTLVGGLTIKDETPLTDGDWLFLGGEAMVFRLVTRDQLGAMAFEAARPFGPVASHSPQFAMSLRWLRLIAEKGSDVLLAGETGVGKEVYAQAIHRHSRKDGPFVAVNCAALPNELVESEMFGYVRGAHSQAGAAKAGVIERANGGTLLLDEIGDMPVAAQAKLLRFVETKEFWPLGATHPRKSDVRIVAATSHLLAGDEAPGLRSDLRARFGATPFKIPPLRERREDLGALVAQFLSEGGDSSPPCPIETAAFLALCRYEWPNNIRELKSVIREALLFRDGSGQISRQHLPAAIANFESIGTVAPRQDSESIVRNAVPMNDADPGSKAPRRSPRPLPGREQLESMLEKYRGNVAEVARALDRDWKIIQRAMERHGIDLQKYRSRV